MSDVIVYSKPNCPQCDLTKRDLDILGIEYKTIDVSQDKDALESIRAMNFRSVPVVVTKTDNWAGYNQEKIKSLLEYA